MVTNLEDTIEDKVDFNFENFYEKYNPYMCNVAGKLLQDNPISENVEDVVNTSWLKLFKKVKENKNYIDQSDKGIKSFLYTVVQNIIIDSLRKKENNGIHYVGGSFELSLFQNKRTNGMNRGVYWNQSFEELNFKEIRSKFRDAVNLLAPERKESFLYSLEGKTSKEISEMTGVNATTIRYRIHMARKDLKENNNLMKIVNILN